MAKRTAIEILRDYVLLRSFCPQCGSEGEQECQMNCTCKTDAPISWGRMQLARETLREAKEAGEAERRQRDETTSP